MSLPTRGETFAKLVEHLRHAQEEAATMAHLERDASAIKARQWLIVSENFKKTIDIVTGIATKGLQ